MENNENKVTHVTPKHIGIGKRLIQACEKIQEQEKEIQELKAENRRLHFRQEEIINARLEGMTLFDLTEEAQDMAYTHFLTVQKMTDDCYASTMGDDS